MKIFYRTFIKIFSFLTAILVFFTLLSLILSFLDQKKGYSNFHYIQGDKNSNNKIALLNLQGPILSEPNNLYNLNKIGNLDVIYPYLVLEYLNELEEEEIVALIVSIDSPGGSVSATHSIYNHFNKFKNKNNIPIIFHSKDMLASGAYWISLSGDKIYTNYGTLIGSIGVKGPDWIYYNSPTLLSSGILGNSVATKNEIKLFSNIAGNSKDILNPFRPPNKKEIKQLQNMVNDIYNDFVNLVVTNRKIEKKTIINDIGAMIYNPLDAKNLFLIDGIKNTNEIIAMIIKDLKIKNNVVIANKKNNFFNFINLDNLNQILFTNNLDNNINYINKRFCNNLKNELSVVIYNNYKANC